MDLTTKKNLIQAIQTSPNDAELAAYLQNISKVLLPTKYKQGTITMRQSIKEILSDEAPQFRLQLEDKFKSLNEFFFLTAGLHVIGAPSGHGKTLWAMKWAECAAKQNTPVLVLSLEMTHKDLSARTLSEITDIPLMKLIKNEMDAYKKAAILDLIDREDYNYLDQIHIEKFGDYDWVKIKPRLVERMIHLKPKLVIVDYVQMISNSNEEDGRVSKLLSDISREFKLFADETGAAVLLLSQLNREAMKETKKSMNSEAKQIHLSHDFIKESGGIVEAADSVQLVCMPQRFDYCPMHLFRKFQVGIHKSRRIGSLGTVMFDFDFEKMSFV